MAAPTSRLAGGKAELGLAVPDAGVVLHDVALGIWPDRQSGRRTRQLAPGGGLQQTLQDRIWDFRRTKPLFLFLSKPVSLHRVL